MNDPTVARKEMEQQAQPAPEPAKLTCCEAHLFLIPHENHTSRMASLVHLRKPVTTIGRDTSVVDMCVLFLVLPLERAPRLTRINSYRNIELDSNQTIVSRVAGKFTRASASEWVLQSTDSVGGVFVNDVRIKRYNLKHNDIIAFGGGARIAVGEERTGTNPPLVAYRFELRDSPLLCTN